MAPFYIMNMPESADCRDSQPALNILTPQSFAKEEHALNTWPVIEASLADPPDTREKIDEEIRAILDHCRDVVSKVCGPSVLTAENPAFRFLTDRLLSRARTVDQARDLILGFVFFLLDTPSKRKLFLGETKKRERLREYYERVDERVEDDQFVPREVGYYNTCFRWPASMLSGRGEISDEDSEIIGPPDLGLSSVKMATTSVTSVGAGGTSVSEITVAVPGESQGVDADGLPADLGVFLAELFRQKSKSKYTRWMGEKWKAIAEGRNAPIGEILMDSFDEEQRMPYFYYGSTNDGPVIIMADPDSAGVNKSYLAHEKELRVKRVVPDEKRMTPEKLTRLLQLKGLKGYVRKDIDMDEAAHLSTNLAVIAEYFCENPDAESLEEITPAHIDRWIRDKFERYRPCLKVATYQWARLLRTEFEQTSLFVEQYILDLHASQDPWLFELAGVTRERCKRTGGLFELYSFAVRAAKERSAEDPETYKRALAILPPKQFLTRALESGEKAYLKDIHVASVANHVQNNTADFCPLFSADAFESDLFAASRHFFAEIFTPITEWERHEGFEILDPMAINDFARSNKFGSLREIFKLLVTKLEQLPPRELLRYKREVVDVMPPEQAKEVMALIERVADNYAIRLSFSRFSTDKLVGIAERRVSAADMRIVLPGGIRYEDLVADGHVRTPEWGPRMADAALLRRHFRSVRGRDRIVEFLMRHRGTMYPSQLVRPFPDSPNLDIIREFGESPDLLTFLQLATAGMYRKFSPEEVLAETHRLVGISETEARPELTTVGIEYEQVGGSEEGAIVSADYGLLFNVFPMGGDKNVNEIFTAPTQGSTMQNLALSFITDPRFKFVDRGRLFGAGSMKRPFSSIHVNVAIPKDLPFEFETVDRILDPLKAATWVSHGGDMAQSLVAKGRLRGWKLGSLLDVMEDKNPAVKIEIRNTAIEPDDSHYIEIANIHLLASAAIQCLREMAVQRLTASGKVMADIYRRFSAEVKALGGRDARGAMEIIKRYSDAIRTELRLPMIARKTEGIILLGQ